MICFADHTTRDELVLANRGLCRFVVKRMYGVVGVKMLGYDEAVAICEAELISAADSYDATKGTFSTWAVFIMRRRLMSVAARWQNKSGRRLPEEYDVEQVEADESPLDLELLPRMLDALRPRHRAILEAYYGIGQPSRDMGEIAQSEGVTRQRIRQIVQHALRTMRESLKRSPSH